MQNCNQMHACYLFQQDKHYDLSYDTGDKALQCGRHVDIFKLWLMWRAKVGAFRRTMGLGGGTLSRNGVKSGHSKSTGVNLWHYLSCGGTLFHSAQWGGAVLLRGHFIKVYPIKAAVWLCSHSSSC